jgi:predicted O-methyltransferase YrrM
MDSRKRLLLGQRLNYLVHGNFHGVSANWLAKQSGHLFSNVHEFAISDKSKIRLSKESLHRGESVFRSVLREKSGKNFKQNFDCEIGLASFLYAYVITYRPKVIVETGVANGITTNVILKAIEQVGGTLHSLDVDPRTQNVYRGPGDWRFHLLAGNLQKELRSQSNKIGAVDLWIHDSDHGFLWQTFEYELAKKCLADNGVLVSDDIDSSTAWGLASKKLFARSLGIFDNRKFFGVATF